MHVAIIGNGVSGITAARYIRKLSDHKITVISSESDYFFSRTALMYIYMGHMRLKDTQPYEDWFWSKNRIELLKDHVQEVNFSNNLLKMQTGPPVRYDKLIIAVGSSSNKFGWPGQDLDRVQGLYSLQDLQLMEQYSQGLRRAVIVGGGLIGIEMAEMLHSRHIPVTLLVREKSFWDIVMPAEESAMINRHILEHGIDLRLGTELKEIIDDGSGKACGVVTNLEEEIDCQLVGLTAGVHPNVDFLRDNQLVIQKGILVDDFLQTNIPNVFAIGDCAQMENPKPGRRPVEAIWYTGRMMGEVVAYNICGQQVPYDPGIWFNSAKFLDIEYQVYGEMPATVPEGQSTFYWEHPGGKSSIRINYETQTQHVKGFNFMGTRFRHEVCEKWIVEKTPIKEVLMNFAMANFDPEFYKEYHQNICQEYEKISGQVMTSTKSRNWNQVFEFIK